MEAFGDTPPSLAKATFDMKEAKGMKSATFVPDLPKGGRYEVMSHNSSVRRASGVPVTIRHADGESTIMVNEGEPAPSESFFVAWAYSVSKGRKGSSPSHSGTDGKCVIVDSVQFLPVKGKR